MILTKSYISYCWAVLTVLLLSCSSDFEDLKEPKQEETGSSLELTVSVNETRIDTSNPSAPTRTIESITATTFSNDDEIGVVVFEGGTYKSNYRYKMVNGEWVAQGDKYTKPATAVTNTFLVYSPYDANISNPATPEAAITDLKTRHKSVLDQHDPAVYHDCDLMTQTFQQSSDENRLYVTLQHEYSVFLIDFRQCLFHTTVTSRDISWASEIVGKDDDAANFPENYSEEKGYVAVSTDGGAIYQRYIPFLNQSANGGDDYYRFIVEPTSTTVKLEWHQKYIEVVKKSKTETEFEKGNLYRASNIFRFDEKTLTPEPGDIYCLDETDETGNTGVILPLSMFKYAKYNEGKPTCTKLKPLGIVFSYGTRIAEEDKDKWDGYALSLKNCPGVYAWSVPAIDESEGIPACKITVENFDIWSNDVSGYKYNKFVRDKANYSSVTYPAFYACDIYGTTTNPQFKLPEYPITSDWYMPSIGQFVSLMSTLAGVNVSKDLLYNSNTLNGGVQFNIAIASGVYNDIDERAATINNYFKENPGDVVKYAEGLAPNGVGSGNLGDNIWSSSVASVAHAVFWDSLVGTSYCSGIWAYTKVSKDYECVRPVFAFKSNKTDE